MQTVAQHLKGGDRCVECIEVQYMTSLAWAAVTGGTSLQHSIPHASQKHKLLWTFVHT